MATTTATLTTTDLDRMATEDDWAGFGYIGERSRMTPEAREACDTAALASANANGMTYAELFAWANSKNGRWYGDCRGDRHAARYLPA